MKRLLLVLSLLLAAGCSDEPVPIEGAGGEQEPPLGDLLPIDEELQLDGLEGPVDVVRDINGRIHIYATNVADAMVVEGYMVAKDRAPQMETFRRFATGRVAEILGQFPTDVAMRQIGLARAGAKMYEQSSPELRDLLDAYASGVSQYFALIRSGDRQLPEGAGEIEPHHYTEWSAVDSLAIVRLFTWQLSYSQQDLALTKILDDMKTTFSPGDADPLVAARAGIEKDMLRFAPADPAVTIDGLGSIGAGPGPTPGPPPPPPVTVTPIDDAVRARRRALIAATEPYQKALESVQRLWGQELEKGSNNWAVGPDLSESGYPMVASDPHLTLSSPSIWWPVSLHVDTGGDDSLNAAGVSFAGTPALVLGHNEHVAWGATVTVYDVTDFYTETLNADGTAVIYNGQEVPLETVEEEIVLLDGSTYTYKVRIVPHHGPILPVIQGGEVLDPDPAMGAISVRWTGLEASGELDAVVGLLRSKDVDEAREALNHFGTGGQNWMMADTSGNIAWSSHINMPYRDDRALQWDPVTHDGQLPCLVLPGDGSAEWTGMWDDDAVPWAKNPPEGYLATANQDTVGGTLDNDPSNDLQPDGSSGYLSCVFAHGFRQGRIRQRIDTRSGPLTLDDMASIQGDHRSNIGARTVPALLLAIDNAQMEDGGPGTHPDLTAIVNDPDYDAALVDQVKDILTTWRDESDYSAESGVDPEFNTPLGLQTPEGRAAQATVIFNGWFVRFLARSFNDELARVGQPNGHSSGIVALLHLLDSDPATLATYDMATGDSALWDDIDTPAVESRQERMIRALVDALVQLNSQFGTIDTWRWGQQHTVQFTPDIPFWADLFIPQTDDEVFGNGFPRHSDLYAVDVANYGWRKAVSGNFDFKFGHGPSQRFVAEMRPEGVVARNALPGGAVFDAADPHFRDQAEQWRRNENHAVPFQLDAVVEAAERRTLVRP